MTVDVLASWVAGSWQDGHGDGQVVQDAVTGEDVARVTSAGIDLAEVARYARQVGGPVLRALDFGQRAAVLKNGAGALEARKEELYDLSARAGSTRRDSAVDVDGGIGTTFVYSSIGRKDQHDLRAGQRQLVATAGGSPVERCDPGPYGCWTLRPP